MRTSQWFLLLIMYGVMGAWSRQPSAEPQDISSINSLSVSNNGIDPKLRKALLRVLNKIKEEENGQLPSDLPEEDFLKVIGEPAQTEDLGSYEISEESKSKDFPYEEAIQFGQKLLGQNKQESQEPAESQNTNLGQSDFSGYFINPPKEQNFEDPQADREKDTPPLNDGSYHYNRPNSGSFSSEEENEKDQTNENTFENSDEETEGQTESNVEEKVTILTEATEESSIQPEVSSTVENKKSEEADENSKFTSGKSEEETTEETTDQEVLTSSVDSLAPSAIAESSKIITEILTSEENEGRSLKNYIQEKGTESKIVTQTNNYSSKYSSFNSFTSEPNFLPTKPTPDEEQNVQGPTPIDIPDIEEEEEEEDIGNLTPQRPVEVRTTDKVEKEIKKVTSKKEKNKDENVRHIVEFVSAPLITAFTVEQDDKGIPHKIIPLDYIHPTQPPAPTEDPEIVAQRQRELEEKEFILQQQLRTLQQEKYKYGGARETQKELLQHENLRYQQQYFQQQPYHQQTPFFIQQSLAQIPELPRQEQLYQQQAFQHYQQNFQRPQEVQRQEFQGQHELQRQQELHRQQEQLRQQQLERHRFQLRNQLQPPQGIDFQKSVDFRLPLFEHNRVHRNEPSRFVSNFGYNGPVTIHGQIQSLISESGISTGLPRNTQADLNIVSKILALNHGTFGPQNQVSNNVKRQIPKVTRLIRNPI